LTSDDFNISFIMFAAIKLRKIFILLFTTETVFLKNIYKSKHIIENIYNIILKKRKGVYYEGIKKARGR